MTNGFGSIAHVRYRFNVHPKAEYKHVNKELDSYFASGLNDVGELYEDNGRTHLKPNVIDIIREQIVQEMYDAFPEDTEETTQMTITQIVGNMAMSIRIGSDVTTLRRTRDLQYALERAALQEHTQLVISLHIDRCHFSKDFSPIDLTT